MRCCNSLAGHLGTMCENARIQATFITTSNRDPNLKSESALTRRMTVQNYESRFVSEEFVDPEKNLYLMDTSWVKTRFSQDKLCLAFFHFLRNEGVVPLNVPKANEQLSLDTLNENDDFLATLGCAFVISNIQEDRVSRDDILKYFPGVPLRPEDWELLVGMALTGQFKQLARARIVGKDTPLTVVTRL